MRKNQKYTKEEMYLAIEIWQESGLSQNKFCKRENIAEGTFSYWLKKYRVEKDQSKSSLKKPVKTFIPIKVEKIPEPSCEDKGQIEISYPNGVQLSCPVNMDVQQLRTLINFQ